MTQGFPFRCRYESDMVVASEISLYLPASAVLPHCKLFLSRQHAPFLVNCRFGSEIFTTLRYLVPNMSLIEGISFSCCSCLIDVKGTSLLLQQQCLIFCIWGWFVFLQNWYTHVGGLWLSGLGLYACDLKIVGSSPVDCGIKSLLNP